MNDTLVKNTAWHARPFQEIFDLLQTSREGIATPEAEKRLQQSGPNVLAEARPESVFRIVLRQLRSPLIYVLLAATVLAVAMGKTTDGLVVLGVVALNTLIGVIQEYQAGQAIQGLLRMIPDSATVWRDDIQKSIPSAQLVAGDYVLLQAGDRVPADLRLIAVKNLRCDESALTGESVPTAKHTDPVGPEAGVGDRRCMAFSGTMVTAGTGSGIVVETGLRTEFGKISQLLESTPSLETPFTRSIGKLAQWITVIILAVGLVIFGISLFRGYTLVDAVFSAISLAVAAIPEGLPAVITIASAIGVRRMAKRRAVVRYLPAVETLGSTTVICSDKTGTLTRNEMTVQTLWNTRRQFRLEPGNTGFQADTNHSHENGVLDDKHTDELLLAGILCNDASLEEDPSGGWKTVGDPTETALLVAAQRFGHSSRQIRQHWPRTDAIPFDSVRKLMATLHRSPSGENIVYLKGAPESLIPLVRQANGDSPQQARQQAASYADAGMRVLAFARKKVADDQTELTEADLQDGFELLGLQAMIDPPRMEVKHAIASCQRAGITVKMITGDHPGTAAAIGRELNLIAPGDGVVTGQELEGMSDEALQEIATRTHIFARVAPEHKLRLVEALQAKGHVVAMTGDGVNDAPALKRADIGVAMGITGTAVSKEAADMVLTDDNFESIEAAVEEGRRVYDNLIKAIVFILPTSVGLGLVVVLAVLFLPVVDGVLLHPMLPVQVLWINLITAVALSLPLALEAKEPDVMRRPPRKPNKPVLGKFVLIRILLVAFLMAIGTVGLFVWEYRVELTTGIAAQTALAEAQTLAVTTMVLFQVFYLLDCRSLRYSMREIGFFSNPAAFLGIAVVLLAQLGFVYLPFMNAWFDSAPLSAEAWAFAAAVAFAIVPVVTLKKWISRRRRR